MVEDDERELSAGGKVGGLEDDGAESVVVGGGDGDGCLRDGGIGVEFGLCAHVTGELDEAGGFGGEVEEGR